MNGREVGHGEQPDRMATRGTSCSLQSSPSIAFRVKESAGLRQLFQRRCALGGIFCTVPRALIARLRAH